MAVADKSSERIIADARADELGRIKLMIDELKAQAGVIEEELKNQGTGVYVGTDWQYTVSESVRWTLNSSALEEFLQKHNYCLDDFKSPSSAVTSGKLAQASAKNKKALRSATKA